MSGNLPDVVLLPGFADVHVHFREPGFSYKERISTGCAAALHGGYTAVCTMPNLSPPPDGDCGLAAEEEIIRRDATLTVLPYGTITKGRSGSVLSDMAAMAGRVAGFSDDGSGVPDGALMRAAMLEAKRLGAIIAAHCEDTTCPPESPESEWRQIERDLELALETGCRYHVCHISTAESASLIRQAKHDGADVSCETAPHYLLLDETCVRDDGRWRMNPPLRSRRDREALLEALVDGTVDMIATDHAPHSREEKSRGFAGSAMGVVGLETAFPVLYTGLVLTGVLTLEKLVALMSTNPRRRFGLPGGEYAGDGAGFCAVDLGHEYVIDGSRFASMGHSTPFDGMRVRGGIIMTGYKGEIKWRRE